MTLPHAGGAVHFRFDDVETRGRSVEAMLTVWQNVPGVTHEALSARIDAISTSNRETVRRMLDDAFGKGAWTTLLSRACTFLIHTLRNADPSVRLMHAREEDSGPSLLAPWIVAGATILFGQGGSAKTFLALDIARAVANGSDFLGNQGAQAPVLFLDYEADASTLKKRMQNLLADREDDDPDPPIHYWPAGGVPVADMTAAIIRKVQAEAIGLVVVDSAALAAGAEPERAETAIRFFNALASLRVPSLIVAHETKAGEDRWPFGSIFYHNSARSTWNAKLIADQEANAVRVGLFHRKSNNARLETPVGVKITFGDGVVHIAREDLDPEWDAEIPLAKRIRRELASGARSVKQLATTLDAKPDSIRRTLNRSGQFIRLPGTENWGLSE